MHDMDRTQHEYQYEGNGFETGEYGAMGEGEYGEGEGEYYSEAEGIFNEADEMELAAELLEVTNEAELDQFIGKLLKRASRAVGGALKSPLGRMLGGAFKSVAGKALPILGGALGSMVAPGIGTMLGGQLGSAAGSMFGLELEGMSGEDQEFEVARRIVRLGGEAVKQAATMPPSANPQATVQAALQAAAQQHAPGLISPSAGPQLNGMPRRRNRGVWMRRGNKLIIYGI